MNHGKTIELFFVDGTADGLVTAELSNWNGKAIKIQRNDICDCERQDIKEPGVYFLFCKGEGIKDDVYIGEAENIKDRLMQHIKDHQSEKEKYYWHTAVIFTGKDLNKASIRYLENRLVELTKIANRYNVLTKSTYKNTVLKESQIASLEEFLDNTKILISALGYKILEPIVKKEDDKPKDVLHINSPLKAYAIVNDEGFVLLKGSEVAVDKIAPAVEKKLTSMREKYLSSGLIKDGVTTDDIVFPSPSAAAVFVLGYSASGPKYWVNNGGKTLKEIESIE